MIFDIGTILKMITDIDKYQTMIYKYDNSYCTINFKKDDNTISLYISLKEIVFTMGKGIEINIPFENDLQKAEINVLVEQLYEAAKHYTTRKIKELAHK